MSVIRPMGTEQEYGILDRSNPHANPVQLSFDVIDAVADGERRHIRWDYRGEDPVHDARGYSIPRASARPDMLTDTPQRFITNTVSAFGARCYVDHAHPEYSSAEVMTPQAAWAGAMLGDKLMRKACDKLHGQRRDIRLYRATTDGKGASWGAHESYEISRSVPFDRLADLMLAHFTSRIVLVGAGRVGIGEKSEQAGFQISQRADFMHAKLGLQTTFERPIVNTRDESHSSSGKRRLHVIAGDANCMPVPNVVKLGSTSFLAWLAECAYDPHCTDYSPEDFEQLLERVVPEQPVVAMHEFSHDLRLAYAAPVRNGELLTAVDIQQRLCDAVLQVASKIYDIDAHGEVRWPDASSQEVMQLWRAVLADARAITGLDDDARLVQADAARRLEWLLKWQVIERIKRKIQADWASPACAACDIAWGALDTQESLYAKISATVQQINTTQQGGIAQHIDSALQSDYGQHIDSAQPDSHAAVYLQTMYTAGLSVRARLRGALLKKWAPSIRAVSWSSIVVEDSQGQLCDLNMEEPHDAHLRQHQQAIAQSPTVDDMVRSWITVVDEK